METERDAVWYLDKAKENQSYSSDYQLCQALNKKSNYSTYIRRKGMVPSPEVMVELAKLAGVDPAIALMDLAMWNSQGEARSTYAKILQKLVGCLVAAVGLNLASSSSAMAAAGIAFATLPGSPVQIMIGLSILWEIPEGEENPKALILVFFLPCNVKLSNISVYNHLTSLQYELV